MANTTVSLGWAATASATSPTTTPSEIQSMVCVAIPLVATQPTEPYVYIDKSSRGFAGGLVYEAEINLFPGNGAFDYGTTAGRDASRNIDLWTQNEPKFVKSDETNWVNRFGSSWVRVTLTAKYDLMRAGRMNQYKLHVRAASLTTLS